MRILGAPLRGNRTNQTRIQRITPKTGHVLRFVSLMILSRTQIRFRLRTGGCLPESSQAVRMEVKVERAYCDGNV